MAELHTLDNKKLGQDFMIRFATTLEDTEALLERDGNADYLCHPREVTALQDILPKSERVEYVKRCRTYIGTDYVKFKTFLMERKSEQQDLAKFVGQEDDAGPGDKCEHCEKPGHKKKDCFKWKSESKGQETVRGATTAGGVESQAIGLSSVQSQTLREGGGKELKVLRVLQPPAR